DQRLILVLFSNKRIKFHAFDVRTRTTGSAAKSRSTRSRSWSGAARSANEAIARRFAASRALIGRATKHTWTARPAGSHKGLIRITRQHVKHTLRILIKGVVTRAHPVAVVVDQCVLEREKSQD